MTLCRFGEKCAEHNGTHPREVYDSAVCVSDDRRTAAALDELPQLYVALTHLYREPRSGSDGPRGTQVHPGLPVRPEVDALMREMAHVVGSWAEIARDAMSLVQTEPRCTTPQTVSLDCRAIRRPLDAFLRLPATTVARHVDAAHVHQLPDDVDGHVMPNGDAVVYRDLTGAAGALELLDLQRRARGMLGQTRRVRRIDVVSCPRCDLLSLTRPEGSEYIECSEEDCGTLLTADEYAERVTGALSKARAELERLDEEEAA